MSKELPTMLLRVTEKNGDLYLKADDVDKIVQELVDKLAHAEERWVYWMERSNYHMDEAHNLREKYGYSKFE